MDSAPTAAPFVWPYSHKPLSLVPEPRRPHNSVRWTADMLSALKISRASGKSYVECAELIGVAISTIQRKCQSMQLNAKPRCKQKPRIK